MPTKGMMDLINRRNKLVAFIETCKEYWEDCKNNNPGCTEWEPGCPDTDDVSCDVVDLYREAKKLLEGA